MTASRPGHDRPATPSSAWLLRAALIFALLVLLVVPSGAQSNLPIESFWVTDADVEAVAVSGGVVYLGGHFSYVGPPTGSVARLDAATGAADPSFPRVDGTVLSLVPDGAGGLYIGGDFTSVGGVPRSSVAHVLADGRVSSWNPNPPAGDYVHSLAVSGRVVYVGGSFDEMGGQPRNNIAAVDAATGEATSWNPDASGLVREMILSGSLLYVGGQFTTIGGQTRPRLAALDVTTGLATTWNPSANSQVLCMLLDGGTLYVGGTFTSVGGQARSNVAAIRTADGAATSWDPSGTGPAWDMALSGTTLYVGGLFGMIGGQARSSIAALDTTIPVSNVTPWNPGANQLVRTLALVGTTLYAGGQFTSIGGQPRPRLAALDTTVDTNNATPWNPGANFDVSVLLADPTTVYTGGSFSSAGGAVRGRLAALDAATGAATNWNPDADGTVAAVHPTGAQVFVGGFFLNVGGQPRDRIAALDTVGGAALAGWDPGADAGVQALASSGGVLYAGGYFTTLGGQPRSNLGALDAATGTPTAWAPGPTSSNRIEAIQVEGSSVYAGGSFDYGGRNDIVELQAATAASTSWNPNANNVVNDLAVGTSVVYAGGSFTTIGGATRQRVAALDRAIPGLADPWNPNASTTVNALALGGGRLFVGGSFQSIGGSIRTKIASFDEPVGALTTWNPPLVNNTVYDLAVGSGIVVAGGNFDSIGGQTREHLAAFCLTEAPTGLAATPVGLNQIDLAWDTGSASSFNVYRSRNAAGPFSFLANSPAPAYSDTAVEGGITYYYVVRGVDACESEPSAVTSASTSGTCSLPPDFDGAGWVEQVPTGTCTVEVGWAPGVDPCGGSVSYSVYRNPAPAFTPGPANLVATVPAGTVYNDTSALSPGMTQYYVVRATGQPSGVEDANLIEHAIVPSACAAGASNTAAFLTVISRSGENVLQWVNPPGFDTVSIHAASGSPCIPPTNPLDVGTWIADRTDPGGPGDRDRFPDTGLMDDTDYCYTVFVNTGAGFSAPRSNRGRPFDTGGDVKWAFSTGTFAYTAPTVGEVGVIAIANDHVLHAMDRGPLGGEWPSGWLPVQIGDKVEERSPVVPIDVGGHDPVIFVGSFDGHVYAIDGTVGGAAPMPWSPSLIADDVRAAPAGIFPEFGPTLLDFLLVGTRNSSGDNSLVALDPDTGTILGSFDNGGGAGNRIGIISGMATVDYPTERVYFTSLEGAAGSNATLWALQLGTSPVFTSAWALQRPLGPIVSSPVLMGDRVYVGSEIGGGTLHAIDAATGAPGLDRDLLLADGPVRGFVFPDRANSDLYFATDSLIWGVHDDGVSLAVKFGGGLILDTGVTPTSPVLFVPGRHYVYVGGSDGKLYELDTLGPSISSVQLGEATPRTVGAPSLDWANDLIHVGTEDGVFYAVEVPLGP